VIFNVSKAWKVGSRLFSQLHNGVFNNSQNGDYGITLHIVVKRTPFKEYIGLVGFASVKLGSHEAKGARLINQDDSLPPACNL
jgi:hypothetical protein